MIYHLYYYHYWHVNPPALIRRSSSDVDVALYSQCSLSTAYLLKTLYSLSPALLPMLLGLLPASLLISYSSLELSFQGPYFSPQSFFKCAFHSFGVWKVGQVVRIPGVHTYSKRVFYGVTMLVTEDEGSILFLIPPITPTI